MPGQLRTMDAQRTKWTTSNERLPHGAWLPWLATEFGWLQMTTRCLGADFDSLNSFAYFSLPGGNINTTTGRRFTSLFQICRLRSRLPSTRQ